MIQKMKQSGFSFLIQVAGIFSQRNSFNNLFLFMDKPKSFLPITFGNALEVRPLTWSDFPGLVDRKLPFSAHIYWSIRYKIVDYDKGKLAVSLHISKRSWVREQKKSQGLLSHEQGHYLIGALCALQFLRRVNNKKRNLHDNFDELVALIFDRTMKQFLEVEINYDKETDHRLNVQKQEKWDYFIHDKLVRYKHIFDQKQIRPVKLPKIKQKQAKRTNSCR